MSAILIYAIKSAILLTLLFLPGIFLMFKEKMFRFNRMTLLAILVLSLVLPLCNFSRLSMDNMPAIQTIEQGLIQAGIPVEVTNLSPAIAQGEEGNSPFPWFYIVSILYAIGVMTILCIRLREVLSMGRIIRRGSIWTKEDEDDGIRIYCHAENVAPFSWLRNIVISEADYKENGREIILHEKAHILYRHSLDILLLTIVEAVQWWNPFVYLLGIYLRDIHEYEADDYVLRQGISCHSYSELVIRKAVGANSYTFANNFNHSLTKKRISMMLKTNSKRSRRSRVLYVLPMIALALSAFATPEFQTATGLIERTVKPSASTFTLEGKVPNALNVDNYLIYIWNYDMNEMPQLVDSVKVMKGKFKFSINLDQPYSGMIKTVKKDGTTGRFYLEFLFVPGEDCKIDVKGEGLNEFTLSGSKFYRDWQAFGDFYQKARDRAIALRGAGDEEYFASIADYNRRHKGEEGSLMYQCMWLANSNMNFSIFDDIQGGRFKRYIQHRKIQYGKETVIDIHIDSDDKLSCGGINHAKPEPISPKDMMELLAGHKGEPTVINITSEKEFSQMKHVVREASRKNEHLKINYEVKPKSD